MLWLSVHEVCISISASTKYQLVVTPESEYRDRLELKSANDRTLGVGVNLSTNLLLILTATNMMKVSLDLEKIKAFRPEYVTIFPVFGPSHLLCRIGRTNLIKSIMMQAILYGASPVVSQHFSTDSIFSKDSLNHLFRIRYDSASLQI